VAYGLSYWLGCLLERWSCVLIALQAIGIDDPTTCEEQQQSAAASALKLPWLGFILGNALVPSQGSLAGEVLGGGSLQDMPGLQDDDACHANSLQATGRTRRRKHMLQARLMRTQQ
jgi:hypothetical protein